MTVAALWAAAVVLALLIDHCCGEPPVAVHPVVWMGRVLGWWGVRLAPAAPTGKNLKVFWLAALIWSALAAIIFIAFYALQKAIVTALPVWAAALLLGVLLKPLLAWRMLRVEVLAVQMALEESLQAGRERLSWLVSRDTGQLDAVAVRESAIETLAENLNDSVVAPIFWFVLLGLPGAALYRFANTADAMWGYPAMHGGRYWQWAGKWAARADDVLSWIPARITAVLLWGLSRRMLPWVQLCRHAARTPSPNSGWPMAAMALALDVRLAKPNVYTLHTQGRCAQSHDIQRAIHLASKTVVAIAAIAIVTIIAAMTITYPLSVLLPV